MLTIPSTHLVVVSKDGAGGRIKQFIKKCNESQVTLLIGSHLANFETFTEYYLPKSAIDRISNRQTKILEKRGKLNSPEDKEKLTNGRKND